MSLEQYLAGTQNIDGRGMELCLHFAAFSEAPLQVAL